MINEIYVREIKERLEKSTPGPWISFIEKRDEFSGSNFIRTGREDIYLLGATEDDQDFVAHAREDIKNLIDEVIRLRLLMSDDNKI